MRIFIRYDNESSFVFSKSVFFWVKKEVSCIGVPRTRGCLGHRVVVHVKVGAVDGPSEAVVQRVLIIVLSAEEGRCQNGCKFIIHPTCQLHIYIATPWIRISYYDPRRYFTATCIRLWYEQYSQSYILSSPRWENLRKKLVRLRVS